MKKMGGLAILLAVLAFVYSGKISKQNSYAVESNSVVSRAEDASPGAMTVETLFSGLATPPGGPAEEVVREDFYRKTHALLRKDDGSEEMIELRDLDGAKKYVETNENQNPADEFNALKPIDLGDEKDSQFGSDFADSGHTFEIMFRYSNVPRHPLNVFSCIYTTESGKIANKSGELDVRSDEHGYAMVRLNSRAYIRMAAAMGELEQDCSSGHCESGVAHTIVYAEIYEKVGVDWKATREVVAQNILDDKNPNQFCTLPH